MKIKIAVTDACIFIDLHNLELTNSFFNLDIEIHTTSAILHELHYEEKRILQVYESDEMLTIHNLQEHDYIEIFTVDYPKSLSEADKSVIHIANKLNACVLSSDKTLRNCAKNKDIEYHGMIWIFDKLVEEGLLSKEDAAIKLKRLVSINSVFQNNQQLVVEIENRLKLWRSESKESV